jgi:hypothetical protein
MRLRLKEQHQPLRVGHRATAYLRKAYQDILLKVYQPVFGIRVKPLYGTFT